MISSNKQFCDRILLHLNHCAPVTARAMFGGYGLYWDGTMFALIAYEKLYFKVDDQNRSDFIQAEMQPFVYEGKHKPVVMSYYELPESILIDPEQLLAWMERSHTAARRGKQKQRHRK